MEHAKVILVFPTDALLCFKYVANLESETSSLECFPARRTGRENNSRRTDGEKAQNK